MAEWDHARRSARHLQTDSDFGVAGGSGSVDWDLFSMRKNSNHRFAGVLSGVFLLTVCTATPHAAVPKGWYVAGNKPTEYEAGIDTLATHDCRPSAFLRSKQPVVNGFGRLMQDIRADRYLGKRVRFSAFVRTDGAGDWAGLWMRVDKGRKQLAFDNRPIKGTTDWRRYEVVLDVPRDATGIFFGVLLSGAGSIWINDLKFEVVGPTFLPNDGDKLLRPDEPTNLELEE